MDFEKLRSDSQNKTLGGLIDEIAAGLDALARIEDTLYRRSESGTDSIGSHFRHNLDFVNSFLNGIEGGQIDYNNRERDVIVEADRHYAAGQFIFAIRRLIALTPEMLERAVIVRSEIDANAWHISSVSREIEFLLSHTVHHYALIAGKLRASEVEISAGFGVAPSTLQYWKQKKAA